MSKSERATIAACLAVLAAQLVLMSVALQSASPLARPPAEPAPAAAAVVWTSDIGLAQRLYKRQLALHRNHDAAGAAAQPPKQGSLDIDELADWARSSSATALHHVLGGRAKLVCGHLSPVLDAVTGYGGHSGRCGVLGITSFAACQRELVAAEDACSALTYKLGTCELHDRTRHDFWHGHEPDARYVAKLSAEVDFCRASDDSAAAAAAGGAGDEAAPPPGAVTALGIAGERNSGTNWLKAMLQANFELPVANNVCGWKHFFKSPEKCDRADHDGHHVNATLVVAVYKNPYDWTLSMHKRPYHAHMHVFDDLPRFIRRPWALVDSFETSKALMARPDVLFKEPPLAHNLSRCVLRRRPSPAVPDPFLRPPPLL